MSGACPLNGGVQRRRGLSGSQATVSSHVRVHVLGDICGNGVLDRPQGADHLTVSGELEGARQVDGLIGEGEPARRGLAGGEVGEFGGVEPEAGDFQDVEGAVVQSKLPLWKLRPRRVFRPTARGCGLWSRSRPRTPVCGGRWRTS